MNTESLKYAKFDHPKHGRFSDPRAVLDSDALSDAEKEEVLRDWKAQLRERLGEPAGHDEVRSTGETVDEAIEHLAALRG
ncbi:hypothetical protein [Mangrovicella endophytica]|uniref:hypothetical protein n=1 Tax=Mangrovicella endophytica TaxID=2066697 RepID=UPI000C9E9900|nr:hypothetical protein [Mangrovicella endophytica]